jgi:hypothetical protein
MLQADAERPDLTGASALADKCPATQGRWSDSDPFSDGCHAERTRCLCLVGGPSSHVVAR